ncbi:unnamed protein product [Prorocentrum cordatum]|uniref:Secreted protein n=1 Tax=Prorocentrum cordatum TaxID=2364126 RepID=A0ABN9PCX4_9DINO|nr:unnamed protein product [Polarella glacialis]
MILVFVLKLLFLLCQLQFRSTCVPELSQRAFGGLELQSRPIPSQVLQLCLLDRLLAQLIDNNLMSGFLEDVDTLILAQGRGVIPESLVRLGRCAPKLRNFIHRHPYYRHAFPELCGLFSCS